MGKLLDLVKAGIITTRLVTLIVVGAAVYMWVAGIEMSKVQETATMLILGYYFGGETFGSFSKKLLEEYIKHMEGRH